MFRIIAIIVTVSALAACETTKGAGKDIEDLGEAIEDAANEPS